MQPDPDAAVVGVAHEPESQADKLEDAEVLAMVEEALAPLGGMGRIAEGARSALVKPNQTIFFHARDGVTTDPRVVGAVVALLREAGVERIVVGDGSGGDLRSANVLKITGTERVARAAGADDVIGFEDGPHRQVEVPVDGTVRHLPLPAALLDADLVVNVPKAKTHFEDPISCCLKNWVGIIHQDARPPVMENPLLYHVVAGLHEVAPAQLNVVDGLWAGVGNGPAANRAQWLGAVVAGLDPVAVDAVVARLMQMHTHRSGFQEAAVQRGIGTNDLARIRVFGADPDAISIRSEPTRPGYDHLPVRVLEGSGVNWAGSLGHLKSLADVFHEYGVWDAVIKVYGRPTFMVGRVHDPAFEDHVEEGPYFVIDDAAHQRYREDPRVTFVPGHPATHNLFPYIFKRLHMPELAPRAMELAKAMKRLEAYYHFRGFRARPSEARGADAASSHRST